MLPDINNEALRAQLNTLQYELDTLKQERELERLEHQSEIREMQNRAEADFKRAQVRNSPPMAGPSSEAFKTVRTADTHTLPRPPKPAPRPRKRNSTP